jgi:catechol 2,3-dioxygenase-like lactoylglutathione lyase family enzyme
MSSEAIQVASMPVGDQAAAKPSYVEVLGFDVVRDRPFTPDARCRARRSSTR